MSPIVPRDLQPAFPVDVPDREIRQKLIEVLGLSGIPDTVPFAQQETEISEDLRATRLTYRNSLGESVPAVLTEPAERGIRPGIVCVSGTGGSADRVTRPDFHLAEDGPLIGWGRELARRGHVTLAISAKGTEGRRVDAHAWALENKHLAPYGRTQMGILVEETLRASRILSEWEGVDSDRVGLAGMSLGGNAAWYAMACAPWIAAGVPVCGGVGSLASVIHGGDPERHSAYYYIPGILRYFDHPRIVAACIPPRPFLMISPTEDEDMPRAGVEALVPVVREAYARSGSPDCFEVYQPPGNHRFLPEYFERMASWFRLHLT